MRCRRIGHAFALATCILMTSGAAFWAASSAAQAQALEHPRVAEMEDQLTKEISASIKARLPDRPFLVTVSVDPLFRTHVQSRDAEKPNDKLPFFDSDAEEIQDEWDDPKVSMYYLLNRVRKIVVMVALPSELSDDDAEEIKKSITVSSHLVAGRDEVQISRRKWKSANQNNLILVAAFGLAALLLTGFFVIGRGHTHKLANAIQKGGGGTVAIAGAPSVPPSASAVSGGRLGDIKSNVELTDPIRLADVAERICERIEANANFPSFRDVLTLDETGRRSSALLGTVLSVLQFETQKKLFTLSKADVWWLEANQHTGTISPDTIEVLNKILRNPRDTDAEWDTALIYIWRLSDANQDEFFRSMTPEEGLAILSEFPKHLAIPIAKRVYPGRWGNLLDFETQYKIPSKKQLQGYARTALLLNPLNSINLLVAHRHNTEILTYLDTADTRDERDVYQSLTNNSVIYEIRPPFFRVFDQDEPVIRRMLNAVSPDLWAFALYNTPHTERQKISKYFTDKQMFVFIESIKRLTDSEDTLRRVGAVRSQIARRLSSLIAEIETEKRLKAEKQEPEDGESSAAA